MRWTLVLVVVLSACGAAESSDQSSDVTAVSLTTAPTTSVVPASTVESNATSSGQPASPTEGSTTTMATTTTTEPPEPVFFAEARETSEAELGVSWRAGCPVGVDALRWVELAHWTMDGRVADGVLVLHVDHVDDVIEVFGRLFAARFPIESMLPITEFEADDNASMRANNSSAFNCRLISGTDRWSQHAYGGAIDINPLINPWVRGDVVDPPEGAPYLDRDPDVPGLITADDVVTEAFASIGWGWGGDWSSSLDYQHFSHNGR